MSDLDTLTPTFRKDVLAFLLKDQIAAKAFVPKVPDDFFEYDSEYHVIFTGFREFIESYGVRPRKHELEDYIQDHVKKLDEDAAKKLFRALDAVWGHNNFSPERVKDKFSTALKVHHINQLIPQIPDYVEEGQYTDLVKVMSEVSHIGDEEEAVIEYWMDLPQRIERRKHFHQRRVKTGFDELDTAIMGGLPRGKLGMLIGGSGKGKSVLLAQLASQASLAGYRTAYITLELDADDVMTRLDAMHTRLTVDSVPFEHKQVVSRVNEVVQKKKAENTTIAELYVQYYPTKSVSIYQVENFVERLRREQGVTLDLLVVDYFDLMKMVGSYDQKYEALEDNCEMLRGLAGKYDMAIWTASQTNRGGIAKELVDMDDMSASYGKVFPLDLLLTMSQTRQEQLKKVMRLHIAKSRLGPSGLILFVEPHFDKMRFNMLSGDEAKRKGLYPKSKKKGSKVTTALGAQGP